MNQREKIECAERLLGHQARMLSASKSRYSNANPQSIVYFNGNIFDSSGEKLWYGDIDLKKDMSKLEALSTELGEAIYATAEQPFRWEKQTAEKLEAACQHEHARARKIVKPGSDWI